MPYSRRYNGVSFGVGPFRWYTGRSRLVRARRRKPERVGYWPVALLLAAPFGIYLTLSPDNAGHPYRAFDVILGVVVFLVAAAVIAYRLSKPGPPPRPRGAPPASRPKPEPPTSAPTVGRQDSWS